MFHPLQRGCKTCADKSGESLAGPALEGSATLLCLPSLVEFLLYRGKADLTVMDENKNTKKKTKFPSFLSVCFPR